MRQTFFKRALYFNNFIFWKKKQIIQCSIYRLISFNKREFKFTLTQQEIDNLLYTLSTINDKELSDLYVSPLLKRKILNEREIVGSFSSLDQLFLCGLDYTKLNVLNKLINNQYQPTEELQDIIASKSPFLRSETLCLNKDKPIISSYNKRETNDDNSFKMNKQPKRLKSMKKVLQAISPNFITKNFDSVTALTVSFSQISWTNINVCREIQDMSSVQLIQKDHKTIQSIDVHNFYDKVLKAVDQLPESDLYVMERFSLKSTESSFNRLSCLMEGMLLALLDKRKVPSHSHPLVFLKAFVVSKLFDLKVGFERKSCIDVGESILSGRSNLKWLSPVSFQPKALQKYILSDYEEKIQLNESILLAIALDSVIIKRDEKTIMLL